jgi:hypothetical protein
MEIREAGISIDRYFICLIAARQNDGLIADCDHFFGRA